MISDFMFVRSPHMSWRHPYLHLGKKFTFPLDFPQENVSEAFKKQHEVERVFGIMLFNVEHMEQMLTQLKVKASNLKQLIQGDLIQVGKEDYIYRLRESELKDLHLAHLDNKLLQATKRMNPESVSEKERVQQRELSQDIRVKRKRLNISASVL